MSAIEQKIEELSIRLDNYERTKSAEQALLDLEDRIEAELPPDTDDDDDDMISALRRTTMTIQEQYLMDKTVRARTLLGSIASACSQRRVTRFRFLADISAFLYGRDALESQILGVGIGRGRPFEPGGLDLGELKVHRARQMGDDLVLRLQQIGARGVELIGPKMRAAVGVDELGVDPAPDCRWAAPSLPAHSARRDPCRSPWRRPACP